MNSATVRIILSISSPDQDEQISLVGQEFIFGRSPNSTVVLNDPNFSRSHFKIYFQDGILCITDMGSSNGTYVNGERISTQIPVEITESDSITVPNSKIHLSLLETDYQSELESTDVFDLPEELSTNEKDSDFYDEEETGDEVENTDLQSSPKSYSNLSEKIYEAAHLKIEQIIHDATVKSTEMIEEATAKSAELIETAEQEIEKKRIEALEESDRVIFERQKRADQEIVDFTLESKNNLQKEVEQEKFTQVETLKNAIASDRKRLLKKLDDEAAQVTAAHEKKKNEISQSINKLEGLLAIKKEEYVNLDIVFEEKLEKGNEELNEKLLLKKKELEKLEKNYQEEKQKLVIQVEKETENRRNELQGIINDYKEKIKLKHKELEAFEAESIAKQEKIVEQIENDIQLKREELLLSLSEIESKILAKKNEIHKLELAHENQKNNQFKILEAQVESKRIELEIELSDYEGKIEAAQKEFSGLFEQYEKKKGDQVLTLDNLKKEKEQIQKEIKDLQTQLMQQQKHTAEELEVNKNLVAAMKTDTEKYKKAKLETEGAFVLANKEFADLQKSLSEIKKIIANEEVLIKQKKQNLQTVEVETKKMFAQKDEILPKITALNAEFAELNKKVQAANHAVANIESEHAKKIEVLKTAFIQKKTDLDEEIRKLKETEEKRVQNIAGQEMARINKIKEDSLRMVLDLEDSITKEISNSTSKVFANTIGMEKFREISPDYDKSIRSSLQAGVLKLLTNELSTPNPGKTVKTLSSNQKMWRPITISAVVSALIFGLLPFIYRQVQDQNDPIRKQMEAEARAAAVIPPKKFVAEKVLTLGSNFTNSVIYTEGFCETYAQENFRSELMKKGSAYLYKQWQIDEEKSIQSYAMIFSMIDLLKEKTGKIDPDNEKKDIGKMLVIEKDTMKKLEKILGNEVRLEAALKFQTRFYQEYIAERGIASGSKEPAP